jgi:molybdopterin-guanine dinucleotide biosynthesis protein
VKASHADYPGELLEQSYSEASTEVSYKQAKKRKMNYDPKNKDKEKIRNAFTTMSMLTTSVFTKFIFDAFKTKLKNK